jgi:hypothetical protein
VLVSEEPDQRRRKTDQEMFALYERIFMRQTFHRIVLGFSTFMLFSNVNEIFTLTGIEMNAENFVIIVGTCLLNNTVSAEWVFRFEVFTASGGGGG